MNKIELNKAIVSIGSNIPQGKEKVLEAKALFLSSFERCEFSSIYTSECVGHAGPDYHNAVCILYTDKDLNDLVRLFKDWERMFGRTESDDYNLIALDIDLVVLNNKILRPRDFSREYFMRGYNELIHPSRIQIKDYVYELPQALIAKHPLVERDQCRLLVYTRDGEIVDTVFREIDSFLPHQSLLVYNNTKVINARLLFQKDTGATIEIFCLEPNSPSDYQLNFASKGPVSWKCLVGNSKKWQKGELHKIIYINRQKIDLYARRVETCQHENIVEFYWDNKEYSFSDIIEYAGEIPIPPYLERKSEECDKNDYQTVYSIIEGSVAAPTAGLHFTNELLDRLKQQGIDIEEVTLHVGAGTFRPVKSDTMAGHTMHNEIIDVTLDFIEKLRDSERPVTAVGTTTIRTLESLYHIGCKILENQWSGQLDQWYPYSNDHIDLPTTEALDALIGYLKENGLTRFTTSTGIIIAPGYRFRIVDNLITNFHQPGSTLLLLIAAILGDKWRKIYRHALDSGYRFLSYGDACLFPIDKISTSFTSNNK